MTIYRCNTCKKQTSILKKATNNKYERLVTCSGCDTSWQVCFICNLRWTSRKISYSTKHFQEKHSEIKCDDTARPTQEKPSCKLDNTNETIVFQNESLENESATTTNKIPSFMKNAKDPNLTISCMPNTSRRFFTHNVVDVNNGIRNIVGNAFQKSDYAMAELEESKLQMRITKFCKSLSQSQQTEFVQILNDTQKTPFHTTRIPDNINDIRKFYLSYNDSIFQNMPTPTIQMDNDHAYISMISLIDHFLAYNLEMNYMTCDDDITIKTDITTCKQAIKIRQSVKDTLNDTNIHPMILYINLWSDDFEPNVYRKNRKSIWIKTVSICPPHDKITSPMYTYVLAIGRKSDNHNTMHVYYNKELDELSKCTFRYCAILKKMFQLLSKC